MAAHVTNHMQLYVLSDVLHAAQLRGVATFAPRGWRHGERLVRAASWRGARGVLRVGGQEGRPRDPPDQ